MTLTSIELCAGPGGQALGLEQAGFEHVAVVEYDYRPCDTLRHNRPNWNVIEDGIEFFDGKQYQGVDLVAGGLPCPPFSIAGKRRGRKDNRDCFPETLRIIEEVDPRAVLIENVPGLMDNKFESYRQEILDKLHSLGYVTEWRLIRATDFGVPQKRVRTILIALKPDVAERFRWPDSAFAVDISVGTALREEMKKNGWEGADAWADQATKPAPTIVGGSDNSGGADLGPTKSREIWAEMQVNGKRIADEPPAAGFEGMPELTPRMVAILQGFPESWEILGAKTYAFRQIGNAFPPPVARALGESLAAALTI